MADFGTVCPKRANFSGRALFWKSCKRHRPVSRISNETVICSGLQYCRSLFYIIAAGGTSAIKSGIQPILTFPSRSATQCIFYSPFFCDLYLLHASGQVGSTLCGQSLIPLHLCISAFYSKIGLRNINYMHARVFHSFPHCCILSKYLCLLQKSFTKATRSSVGRCTQMTLCLSSEPFFLPFLHPPMLSMAS